MPSQWMRMTVSQQKNSYLLHELVWLIISMVEHPLVLTKKNVVSPRHPLLKLRGDT